MRKIAKQIEKKEQEEIKRDDSRRDVNIKFSVYRRRFLSRLDIGASNFANESNTIDPKLENFLINPSPIPANIESLI